MSEIFSPQITQIINSKNLITQILRFNSQICEINITILLAKISEISGLFFIIINKPTQFVVEPKTKSIYKFNLSFIKKIPLV